MCYDGFKARIIDLPIDKMKNNLDFTCVMSPKTGVQYGSYDLMRLYKDSDSKYSLNLKIYESGNSFVNGSIHKFWQNVNSNLFTLKDCQQAFKILFEAMECNADKANFTNLEIGVNVIVDFNPDLFLNRIISYKGKAFKPMGKAENSFGLVCETAEYDLKIYNKSREYNLPFGVLRIEKKITDSKFLKRNLIKNISDALEEKNVRLLLSDLSKSFDEVLYDDITIDEEYLTTMQKIALSKYRNPKYWLKPNMSKGERRNSKNRFRDYIKKYGSETYRNEIKENFNIAVEKILTL